METERIPEYLAANAARAVARLHALPVPPSFIFTTDFHAHDNSFVSAAVMKYLHAQTGVHRVFCGGDFPYAFGAPEDCVHDTERSLDYLETLKPELELYVARGNHDITIRTSWTETTGYTHPEADTNRLLMSANSPVAECLAGDVCYYVDDPEQRVRYIVVNTSDSQSDDTTQYWGVHCSVGERQLRFLAERALHFENGGAGWSVVVFGHVPCSRNIPSSEASLAPLAELLAAFRNRRPHPGANFEHTQAELAAYLCGHNHVDHAALDDGVLHVSSGAEAYYSDDVWARKPGTDTEILFDVCALDAQNRTLYMVRVGAGEDRCLRY